MSHIELRNPISIGVDVPLSQVARVGELLFLAGQCSLDETGQIIGEGDVAVQTREAIDHLRVVLADFGGSLNDVAAVTVYLRDVKADYAAFNQAYADSFAGHRPPRTTVQALLALDDLLVEISAIAVVASRLTEEVTS